MTYQDRIKEHPLVKDMLDIVRKANSTAQVILYGSRARGDHRPDSDWDVLVLVDKLSSKERERIWNPINQLELKNNTSINPIIRTKDYWNKCSFTPFHHNVTKDGIVLS